jgi:hypothetical protein
MALSQEQLAYGGAAFNEQVLHYLDDYFRDSPARFRRLYRRMADTGSDWVPSFSLMAMLLGPAWFAYRRHYVAMSLSMIVINSMLLIGYFSDKEEWVFIAMMTAALSWAFCGLFARSLVLRAALRTIVTAMMTEAEPLLQRRRVWRAGGVDAVTGLGMMAGQAAMMFPLVWELLNGPILLWPVT